MSCRTNNFAPSVFPAPLSPLITQTLRLRDERTYTSGIPMINRNFGKRDTKGYNDMHTVHVFNTPGSCVSPSWLRRPHRTPRRDGELFSFCPGSVSKRSASQRSRCLQAITTSSIVLTIDPFEGVNSHKNFTDVSVNHIARKSHTKLFQQGRFIQVFELG